MKKMENSLVLNVTRYVPKKVFQKKKNPDILLKMSFRKLMVRLWIAKCVEEK